jgi:predicted GTPase
VKGQRNASHALTPEATRSSAFIDKWERRSILNSASKSLAVNLGVKKILTASARHRFTAGKMSDGIRSMLTVEKARHLSSEQKSQLLIALGLHPFDLQSYPRCNVGFLHCSTHGAKE